MPRPHPTPHLHAASLTHPAISSCSHLLLTHGLHHGVLCELEDDVWGALGDLEHLALLVLDRALSALGDWVKGDVLNLQGEEVVVFA